MGCNGNCNQGRNCDCGGSAFPPDIELFNWFTILGWLVSIVSVVILALYPHVKGI